LLGSAVGAALSNALSDTALAAWGWRAAFISGIVVAVVGVIIRRNMYDTPAAVPEISPVRVAFRHHKLEVLRTFGLNMAPAATYYLLFVYAATWLTETAAVPRAAALDITTLSILTFLVVAPAAAWVSDRFGRKLMLIVGMSACLLFAYPLAALMHEADAAAAAAAAQMIFAALLALYMASIPAAMCEMFPHNVRVTAVSVGYGLAYALFGGTAPAVAVWLISRTGNDLALAWYIVALTAVSLTIALTTRDRRNEPLDDGAAEP
jgi:MHS family proline/betaine transporter-like MFS transporter